jgi:hypothetical protein
MIRSRYWEAVRLSLLKVSVLLRGTRLLLSFAVMSTSGLTPLLVLKRREIFLLRFRRDLLLRVPLRVLLVMKGICMLPAWKNV